MLLKTYLYRWNDRCTGDSFRNCVCPEEIIGKEVQSPKFPYQDVNSNEQFILKWTNEVILPILPHPSRAEFDAITADSNPIADVPNPVAETWISGKKLSIDNWKSELDVSFVVPIVSSGYNRDLAKRKCWVVDWIVLVKTDPVAGLRSRSISVPIDFYLPLLNITTGHTLGQWR